MIDITVQLIEFADANSGWDIETSKEQLASLTRVLGGRVDWDPGAGENWGRVLDEHSVLSLVSMRGPLIFILDSALLDADKAIDSQFVTINVPSMESDDLTVDTTVLLRVFGARAERFLSSGDRFSVDNLWYSTVT
jgi:hypothetical protein